MLKRNILQKINLVPFLIVIILFMAGYLDSVVPTLVSNQNYISNGAKIIDIKLNKMVYKNNEIQVNKNGEITYFNGGARGSSNKNGYINIFKDKVVLSLNASNYKIPVAKFNSVMEFKDDVKNTVSMFYIMSIVSIFVKYLATAIFIAAVMFLVSGLLARKLNIIKIIIKPLCLSFSISSLITFIIWYTVNLNIMVLNGINIFTTSLLFGFIMLNFFRHSMEQHYLGEEEI